MSDIKAVTYSGGVAVTPSDTAPIAGNANAPKVFAGFYVGGGSGTATIITADGDTIALAGLLTGVIYPIELTQVKATGTGATGIIALRASPFTGDRHL